MFMHAGNVYGRDQNIREMRRQYVKNSQITVAFFVFALLENRHTEVMKMERNFITIVSIAECNRFANLRAGDVLTLRKEPLNRFDDEAIAVYSGQQIKSGYVANSVSTVARGTHSAGYIWRDFEDTAKCTVRFIFEDGVIAELNEESKQQV